MTDILDSRQMLAFVALARRGSFTEAAKDLFLTQSAVSHAMKALEREVGCRLVDRSGKRVTLTQAGEQLLRHAERILAEMRDARMGLDEISKWGHGRLRLGASTTACQYFLPAVLREFKQSFPKCLIRIEPSDSPRQLELLRSQQIDLAIMLASKGLGDVTYVPLFTDELRFVVAPMHPWARLQRDPRSDLVNETLILYNQHSATFRMVIDHFREERVGYNNFMELGSMEAIKELVKLGLGVAVLAPWIVRSELETGSLVQLPLGTRPLTREWGVGYLKGRRLALGEETFVGLCQSATEGFEKWEDKDRAAV
jgi:DNA-binding transcriptional LysR family regulator